MFRVNARAVFAQTSVNSVWTWKRLKHRKLRLRAAAETQGQECDVCALFCAAFAFVILPAETGNQTKPHIYGANGTYFVIHKETGANRIPINVLPFVICNTPLTHALSSRFLSTDSFVYDRTALLVCFHITNCSLHISGSRAYFKISVNLLIWKWTFKKKTEVCM